MWGIEKILKEESYKKKSILRINTQLLNNNVEKHDIFSKQKTLSPTINRDHDVNVESICPRIILKIILL